MNSIPLVRARYANAFLMALKKRGVTTGSYVKSARLPESLLLNPDGLISALSLWKLAGDIGRDPDQRDIGLEAGALPISAYGDFGRRVTCAPSLYKAIKTFCHCAASEYSRSDFYLTRDNDIAWFCRGPIEGTMDQAMQVEFYLIMLMIQIVRAALGPHWKPDRLRLQTLEEHGQFDSDVLRGINIKYGAPYTAIGIPLASLAAPLSRRSDDSAQSGARHLSGSSSQALSENLKEGLKQLLASHVNICLLPIDLAAEIVGVSSRTLQRYLMKQGTTYTLLIDEICFKLSREMMLDKNLNITDIAFELGYSDVAHFSRAFRRITGLSPRCYRQQCLQ
jgi:AraC-like DNA-binding protein